jgi:Beta-propeller repeat/PQQ-like domain
MQRDLDYTSPASAQVVNRLILIAAFSSVHCVSSLAAGPTVEWTRQIGSTGSDSVEGVSLDGLGNLYISGTTSGSLGGQNAGGDDAFLGKYDLAGNQLWIHQYGAAGNQKSGGVAADAAGNVFYTDYYSGIGPVLHNFDGQGNELWSRQSLVPNFSYAVSANGVGNAYIVGGAYSATTKDDGLLVKYDDAGNQLWSRQFGTTDYDQSLRVSADALGNVFAYANTIWDTGLGSKQRVILTKFDSSGNEYWTQELESARYVQRGGVVADGLGNVYISGSANAPLDVPRLYGGYDAFLAKYDAEGNQVWIREFGTADFTDSANGVAVDGLGNVFVAGSTGGSLGGMNAGGGDAFLAKFDANGNQLWIHQYGTDAPESASYVSADAIGHVYVAGTTRGDLGGPNAGGGGYDVYLAKFYDNDAGPPGDYNGNGTVEDADLTLLLNNWGANVLPVPDGWIGAPLTAPAVDNDELIALLNNWGAMPIIGDGENTSIPEPLTLASALMAILGWGVLRTRDS